MLSGLYLGTVILLLLLLAGCVQTGDPFEAKYAANQARIFGGAEGAPPSCDAARIAERVSELFRSVARADGRSAAAFFGIDRPDVPFAWFSFTDTASATHFTVRTSADSSAYRFSTMDARNLSLRAIDVIGWVPERQSVAFLLFFDYTAVAAPIAGATSEWRFGMGKAEYHCPSETFLVMSLARQPEHSWRELYARLITQDEAD